MKRKILKQQKHNLKSHYIHYKIASKVIAKRIKKVQMHFINPDQTGFIKGRYMFKMLDWLRIS